MTATTGPPTQKLNVVNTDFVMDTECTCISFQMVALMELDNIKAHFSMRYIPYQRNKKCSLKISQYVIHFVEKNNNQRFISIHQNYDQS